jgi:hypothetical protein
MAPFIALSSLFLLFAGLGAVGVHALAGWYLPLRLALAGMFLLTASAPTVTTSWMAWCACRLLAAPGPHTTSPAGQSSAGGLPDLRTPASMGRVCNPNPDLVEVFTLK